MSVLDDICKELIQTKNPNSLVYTEDQNLVVFLVYFASNPLVNLSATDKGMTKDTVWQYRTVSLCSVAKVLRWHPKDTTRVLAQCIEAGAVLPNGTLHPMAEEYVRVYGYM